MKRLLFIVNPRAGKLKARAALMDILEVFSRAGHRVTVALTQYRGQAVELAAEGCTSGLYDQLICCGGDGTLNEVVSGVMQAGGALPIGYIPAGSTNDFASCIGLSADPAEAAEAAANGTPLSLDLGRFGDNRFFTYIASFGAFTEVSYATAQDTKNALGHLAYVLEGIRDLGNIRPITATVECGGERITDDWIFGSLSNSTSVGGIVRLREGLVDLTDGLFELLLIRTPKTASERRAVIQGILGSDFSDGMFRFLRCAEARFTAPQPLRWSLDGEFADGGCDVSIRVEHGALHLLR